MAPEELNWLHTTHLGVISEAVALRLDLFGMVLSPILLRKAAGRILHLA